MLNYMDVALYLCITLKLQYGIGLMAEILSRDKTQNTDQLYHLGTRLFHHVKASSHDPGFRANCQSTSKKLVT